MHEQSREITPQLVRHALGAPPRRTVAGMGLIYRRRKRLGARSWLNVSKSGASVSEKLGPLTVNSRGRVRLRLGKGLSWRIK